MHNINCIYFKGKNNSCEHPELIKHLKFSKSCRCKDFSDRESLCTLRTPHTKPSLSEKENKEEISMYCPCCGRPL